MVVVRDGGVVGLFFFFCACIPPFAYVLEAGGSGHEKQRAPSHLKLDVGEEGGNSYSRDDVGIVGVSCYIAYSEPGAQSVVICGEMNRIRLALSYHR